MSLYRVRIIWGGSAAAGGGLSTFYFDTNADSVQQAATAVTTFLAGSEDRRSTAATWTLDNSVDWINDANGELQGTAAVTAANGVGTIATDIMPSANQGLLRLLTGVVVGGRFLRGRVFLPGTCESDNSGGAPTSTYRTDYDTLAAAMIADANTEWRVWSSTHGTSSPVTAANTWTSWAVLRSRRD